MKKPQRPGAVVTEPLPDLLARATTSLQQARFKEAVELFKTLVKREPRPEWQQLLAEAYRGRARALAAKRMFKEAAMVLENTLAADGTLAEPLFYLDCLIRDGQQPKAAGHAILYIGRDAALPPETRAPLADLTAALLVTTPPRPEPARPHAAKAAVSDVAAERARWLDLAAASRAALDAWSNGAPAAEVAALLAKISLRSPFRPVRVLVQTLLDGGQDAERSRRLLESIPASSPFFALREAVAAALGGPRGLEADTWHSLSPTQQGFVAEARGLPPDAAQFLARLAEATRGGAATLFAFLLRQFDQGKPEATRADLRGACLNLLADVPDRLGQFEKTFGPLSPVERARIQALAAERRGQWDKAELSWRQATNAVAAEDAKAGLMRGVIFRHLADLALLHHEIAGLPDGPPGSPRVQYLECACAADPAHVPSVLALIECYRDDERAKEWHQLADDAAQRFAQNSAVLQQAVQSAVARKAYKKASGYARRLLRIDPINAGVRRQMIELQVAHARKQVRGERLDLATKELAAAAEWERPDAPNALLRIARGLVGRLGEASEIAEAWLDEGVALAGGGVAGWFRANVEAELMRLPPGQTQRLHEQLTRARAASPPTREAVLAVVAALGQAEAEDAKRGLANLLAGMTGWLEQAAGFAWSASDFQVLAEALLRLDAFELLAVYARAGRQRDADNAIWRFYEIVARVRGDSMLMSGHEIDELDGMLQAAVARREFRLGNRIERFLSGESLGGAVRRRRPADLPDDIEAEVSDMVMQMLMHDMPPEVASMVRKLVAAHGPAGATEVLMERLDEVLAGPEMSPAEKRATCAAMVSRAMLPDSRPAQSHGGGRTARRGRA